MQCRESLEELDVSWCRGASEAWLGVLADSCSSLHRLTIFGCSQVPFSLDILHCFAAVMHDGDFALCCIPALPCSCTTCLLQHAFDACLHDLCRPVQQGRWLTHEPGWHQMCSGSRGSLYGFPCRAQALRLSAWWRLPSR